MKVDLTGESEEFVQSQVQCGAYASANDVIEAGLRLLKEQETLDRAKLADLQRAIALGIDQADRGELAPLDPHATLSRIRARQSYDPRES